MTLNENDLEEIRKIVKQENSGLFWCLYFYIAILTIVAIISISHRINVMCG